VPPEEAVEVYRLNESAENSPLTRGKSCGLSQSIFDQEVAIVQMMATLRKRQRKQVVLSHWEL
jgi:hypothetical protein